MEDNKLLYIAAIIIVVILIIFGVGLFFYMKSSSQVEIPPPPVTNTNQTGSLPGLPTLPVNPDNVSPEDWQRLEKEKKFISSFWQTPNISYQANVPPYQLPLEQIKEQLVNYQDFSRKIDIEFTLPKLLTNGFVIINNLLDNKINDWENNFRLIKNNNLPILITSDSAVGLYQDTLQITYKEIEEEIFYDSLWRLLKEMYRNVKDRYEPLYQDLGIESDLATEASRLELCYLTVALELLRPKENQIKETIGTDKKFFSPQESAIYALSIPPHMKDEIDAEIKLINAKTITGKSPIFRYDKSYQIYNIPAYYQTSEKLKNYYLAVTWLHDILFPLWSKGNDCLECTFDEHDHSINFVASLYLSNDLSNNQELKNRWANIYKSISFFKGLEVNLTYLDYNQALKDIFGPDYDLTKLFGGDDETAKERINLLQERINAYNFSAALSGEKSSKEQTGLRLLRKHFLLETKLFDLLSGSQVGNYLKEVPRDQPAPFTACKKTESYYRCVPFGLDLFNALGNNFAKKITDETNNNQYAEYENLLNGFKDELNKFDQNTWHDNAYLSLLFSLKSLDQNNSNYPSFMQNDSWIKKSLNTSLGSWVGSHKEINLEITAFEEDRTLENYFPYGYVEPQIDFYSQLLSNTNMIIDGFTNLQIITDKSKYYKRLENLKMVLERIIDISKKELANEKLAPEDYTFINNFHRQIKGITGDVKKQNLQNQLSFSYQTKENKTISQYLSGLNHLIVVYPDSEGKLFLAIGPVFNYQEGKDRAKVTPWWQADFRE
jgi:hypothetical protein